MSDEPQEKPVSDQARTEQSANDQPEKAKEIGGAPGPEPTRYGDWERNGRCTDF
ncbi:MAG: DUF1674 domain-containing protein [Spiribacter sp.]|jgi:hypothetical protein|nr:DUF1674 domain-containing protein [Spiribacter sp.]MDR9490021.1 DUF1674 domain-containing protein [Spiribacter sp.]